MQQPAQGGGMMSGLGGTLVTGMALGAGSEVGHQAVRAMMGSGSGHGSGEVQQQAPAQQQMAQGQYQEMGGQQQEHPCAGFNNNFMTCLRQNNSGIDACQQYMDMLTQCERDNAMRYQ